MRVLLLLPEISNFCLLHFFRVFTSGFQRSVFIRITWRACYLQTAAPPPEMLIQQAWGGAEEFAFLTLPRCCWCCITRICTNRRIFGKKKRKKIVFFHLILNLYQCSPFCFNIWCFLYKVISKTHPNTEIKKICSWPPLHTPVPFPRAGWSVLAADDVRTAQSKALDLAPVCVELKLWVCRGIFVHKDA